MLLRYMGMAMDDAPKGIGLKPVDKPVDGKGVTSDKSAAWATKYPGSFGNTDCKSKNPKGCANHKTGEFAAPGSPYEAKGIATATAVKATASKATAKKNITQESAKEGDESGFKTLAETDAHIKNLIDNEPDPVRKAKMKAAWDKDYANLMVKEALAKMKAQNAVETALAASGQEQATVKIPLVLPEEGDYDGWKEHYKKLYDGKKAQLEQQYAAGQIDDDAYTDALEAAKDKYDARCAKVDKKAKAEADAKAAEVDAQQNATSSSEQEPAKTAPPPPQIPDDDDEEGQKKWHQSIHDESMQALNDEWSKGGMSIEAYGKRHNAITKKLKAGLAEVQAKFHPDPNPDEETDSEGGASGKPENPPVNMTGIASDDQQKEVSGRVSVLNDAMKNAGIGAQITAVHATPFATAFVFHHEGELSAKDKKLLESKLGDSVNIVRVKGKSDTWAITENNAEVANVSFDKMMEDESINKQAEGMTIPMCLGLNEKGKYQVIDLANLPHLLMAGSTGGGKSTIFNSALVSLLSMRSPDEIEVYCVDGKGTEFNAYKDLKHVRKAIIGPDAEGLKGLLDDCIQEMNDRNDFFTHLQDKYHVTIHDLKGYDKFRKKHPELNLPKIRSRLVPIEEIGTFAKDPKVREEVMGRLGLLGEKARSAGIHLIVSTQDAVKETVGSLKKLFPARIVVQSNEQMAKNVGVPEANGLTGHADAYFREKDGSPLVRFKGAFINDQMNDDDDKSELDSKLDGLSSKWGKAETTSESSPSESTATNGAAHGAGAKTETGAEKTVSDNPLQTSTAESVEIDGGKNEGTNDPPLPKPDTSGLNPSLSTPYTTGKTSPTHHYPNTKEPVDISHLGFFQAMMAAWRQGAKGNTVTYDHKAFQRIGAENWAKHLAEQKGEAPDYSQHHLATIHPLPETANDHQKEMYKRWCSKVNAEWNKGDKADPARIHAIELQYLKWLKDEGLDVGSTAASAAAKPPHVNKYINQLSVSANDPVNEHNSQSTVKAKEGVSAQTVGATSTATVAEDYVSENTGSAFGNHPTDK